MSFRLCFAAAVMAATLLSAGNATAAYKYWGLVAGGMPEATAIDDLPDGKTANTWRNAVHSWYPIDVKDYSSDDVAEWIFAMFPADTRVSYSATSRDDSSPDVEVEVYQTVKVSRWDGFFNSTQKPKLMDSKSVDSKGDSATVDFVAERGMIYLFKTTTNGASGASFRLETMTP